MRPDDPRETGRRLTDVEERVKLVATGVGAPAFQPEKGRLIYVRQDGGTNTTVYIWDGAAWVAVGSGGGGGVTDHGALTGLADNDHPQYQAHDTDLDTIAGLTATTDSFMQAKSSAWAARTIAQVKTDLGLTGTNSGDQTITLTGDVTGTGTGSFAATVANDAVTYAKLQNVSATSRILGRKTAGAGDTEELTFSEALDFVGSATQGDILYRDASSWTRLAAGTSGYVLTSNGAGTNPSWQVIPEAAMTFIDSDTVSAQTTITISGLDLDAAGRYYVAFEFENATGSIMALSLYVNGDTTATNYHAVRVGAASGSVGTTTTNTANFTGNVAATTGLVEGYFYMRRGTDGFPRAVVHCNKSQSAATNNELQVSHISRETSANVTSITISSSIASSLTGSMSIWKIQP